MSMNGLGTFEKNVRTLIHSKTFQNSDFGGKGEMAYRILNSRFGLGSMFGFGTVDELRLPDVDNDQSSVSKTSNKETS